MQTPEEIAKARLHSLLRSHAGPVLLAALEDPATCEVMLNPDGVLWVERQDEDMCIIGNIAQSDSQAICDIVASSLGTTITSENPQLDGEWPLDGSRFSGAIPPIVPGPAFTIRKHASRVIPLQEYVTEGIITTLQRDIIQNAIETKRNILLVGGTGSGKTTFANALIGEMLNNNQSARFITVEDTIELQCAAKNIVPMRTSETKTMTDLIKQVKRFRPDIVCVGEVRDGAALDLMDVWNSGHKGGVSTLHANSVYDGLLKLRELISRNEKAPTYIEDLISRCTDYIVYIEKSNNQRKVKGILHVKGYSYRKHSYIVEYLDSDQENNTDYISSLEDE